MPEIINTHTGLVLYYFDQLFFYYHFFFQTHLHQKVDCLTVQCCLCCVVSFLFFSPASIYLGNAKQYTKQ